MSFVFLLTVLLWFFREPGFIPGWGILFKDDYVANGTVATAMGFLLFILPREKPDVFCNSKSKFVQTLLRRNWKRRKKADTVNSCQLCL